MACTDNRSFDPSCSHRYNQVSASLCAVLSVLEARGELEGVLVLADWRESGTSEIWLRSWWAEHKREDERRRASKQQELDRERTRTAALSKLTPAERAALGFRG